MYARLLLLIAMVCLCDPIRAAESGTSKDAARVRELEATVAALTKENRELRAMLVAIARTSPPPAQASAPAASAPANVGSDYWLSESGKRHVRGCRYFGTGKGRAAKADEGEPCRLCGG